MQSARRASRVSSVFQDSEPQRGSRLEDGDDDGSVIDDQFSDEDDEEYEQDERQKTKANGEASFFRRELRMPAFEHAKRQLSQLIGLSHHGMSEHCNSPLSCARSHE